MLSSKSEQIVVAKPLPAANTRMSTNYINIVYPFETFVKISVLVF